MNPIDYYLVLGVTPSATKDEIKSAYRKLARKYHPDVSTEADSELKMRALNEANDVLSDDAKRQAYDYEQNAKTASFGDRWSDVFSKTHTTHSYYHGGDPTNNFDELMRRAAEQSRARQAGARPQDKRWPFENTSRTSHAEVPSNKSVTLSHSITIHEAFTGKDVEVTYQTSGGVTRTVNLTIPPGVQNGDRVKCLGGGSQVITNLPAGDLYINLTVVNNTDFKLDDNHVHLDVPINVLDMMVGRKVNIQTIDGLTLEVTIPAGTQLETKIRLTGRGMPAKAVPHKRGDMFLNLKPFVPKIPSDSTEAIKALDALRALI